MLMHQQTGTQKEAFAMIFSTIVFMMPKINLILNSKVKPGI